MIHCPWCGTNYPVFQSNCDNCGGPLPYLVAGDTSVPRSRVPQDSILVPPPSPRPISSRYLWRLLMADSSAIVGLVLASLGWVFTFVGAILTAAIVPALVGIPLALLGLAFLAIGGPLLYRRYHRAQTVLHVLREGSAVEGQILTLEQNLGVRINGRHPWVIAYEFEVNGRRYQGEVTTLSTPSEGLQPGRTVYALYLPDSPEHNALYPHP